MKQQKGWLIAFAVTLVFCVLGIMALVMENGNTRDATQEEIDAAQVYIVDWEAAGFPGTGDSVKEKILSQCSYIEQTKVNQTPYESYSCDILGDYLYQFRELQQILVGEDDVLYISYITLDDGQAVLAYGDEGLVELSVYYAETDALYYQTAETQKMWLNFRGTAE